MPNLYRCKNNILPKKINNYEDEKRGEKKPSPPKSKKKKLNFKTCKKNTIKSLNEVEFFLNDFKRFTHYLKIYKLFK